MTTQLSSTATLEEALRPIERELAAVGERVLAQLGDPVARKVVYLITAGGKRLRPALVVLAGTAAGDPNAGALIDTAAAVELIHTATLIHDDIIDQSPIRRRQPAFHHRWGTERAVLMGDYLYASAFALIGRLGVPFVNRILAEVCEQLSRGELREVEARYRLDVTEEEYLEIIRDKTASLIEGCCRTGAYLGRGAADVLEGLGNFGTHFGLAFQIIDDCLDLTGDPRQLGKSILADLDKGCLSLPMIYLLEVLSAKERARLFGKFRARSRDPHYLRRIAEAARGAGAVDRARARARGLLQTAQAAIERLPMNGVAEAYGALSDYALARRS